ncbi:hypothetical protein F1880_001465, partial [Penicillium rolfsii]
KLRQFSLRKRQEAQLSSTAKICFKFLDQTSRSFSPVIKELHQELVMPVCVFYLILRGLDTVEDDTSIPIDVKQSLLRNFYDNLDQCGWSFTGNRPEEKDRELLVQFHNVIAEFGKLNPIYRAIIKEITRQMGTGMADFAVRATLGYGKMNSVEAYDLYCWHVAGVVGEGLTLLFVQAGMGDKDLMNQPLYRSMGLLLQKNNIIRDVHEDFHDGRQFWPKEIWLNHVDNFEDLFDPRNIKSALNCSSEMVLNAIRHCRDCLSYLAGLKEQSVFNFCAIPQTMALATLQLCFRNPAIFQHNVKLKKGETLHLMIDSSRNIETVAKIFSHYIRQIHQKNDQEDPNYLSIKVACEEIEDFAKTLVAARSVGLSSEKTGGKRHWTESHPEQMAVYWTVASIFFALGVLWLLSP